jgi:hypothetical protein
MWAGQTEKRLPHSTSLEGGKGLLDFTGSPSPFLRNHAGVPSGIYNQVRQAAVRRANGGHTKRGFLRS